MKFIVCGTVTISCYTKVEAETAEAAKQIAEGRPLQMVQTAERQGESPDTVWCHSGELDGTPEILRAEPE